MLTSCFVRRHAPTLGGLVADQVQGELHILARDILGAGRSRRGVPLRERGAHRDNRPSRFEGAFGEEGAASSPVLNLDVDHALLRAPDAGHPRAAGEQAAYLARPDEPQRVAIGCGPALGTRPGA